MTKQINDKATEEAEFERLVAEEDLILEAQMLIQRALNDRGLTQKELADMLGVGPSYVSQMLGVSSRNLTLRTVARVMHALGAKAELRLKAERVLSEAKDMASAREADEAAMLAARAAATLGSEAWGNVVPLPPRERRKRSREDAGAYAAFDPPYLKVA